MANQELIDYINRQRVHGASVGNIKNALLHAGWEEADIDKGLKATERPNVPTPPAPDAVIKPDGAAPAEATVQSVVVKKRAPIAAIIFLVLGIIAVATAAGIVYLKFLRPQPARKVESAPRATTTKTVTQTPAETIPVQPSAQVPEGGALPVPVNSEMGKVQVVPVPADAISGTSTR